MQLMQLCQTAALAQQIWPNQSPASTAACSIMVACSLRQQPHVVCSRPMHQLWRSQRSTAARPADQRAGRMCGLEQPRLDGYAVALLKPNAWRKPPSRWCMRHAN